jgi:hypothetical protein
MNRRRWSLAALALIALAALISGCGSSAPTETGSGSGSDPADANAQKGVKFAECMRSNGVSRFPDPNASGKLTIDAVANGSGLNTSTPVFKQAISACKNLEPAGFTGSKRSSQQQQAGLKFAQCIRANGVPDFPDPLPNGPLVDTNRIPSAAQPGGMSALHAAMQKCRDVAAAAGLAHFGVKALLLAGLGFIAIGQLWLAQITVGASYASTVLPGQVLTAFGMGLAFPTASVAVTSGVQRSDQGLAGALFTTAQQTGAAIGLAMLATLAAARTTNAHHSLTAGYRFSFLVAVGIAVAAAGIVARQLSSRSCQQELARKNAGESASLPEVQGPDTCSHDRSRRAPGSISCKAAALAAAYENGASARFPAWEHGVGIGACLSRLCSRGTGETRARSLG